MMLGIENNVVLLSYSFVSNSRSMDVVHFKSFSNSLAVCICN